VGRCSGIFSGLGSSKKQRNSFSWRPKATQAEEGPGWRHERHSAARSLERRSGRLPRSVRVRKTSHARDECIGRVLTDGSRSGLSKPALFTDGTVEAASGQRRKRWLGGQTELASFGHVETCAGSGVGPRVSTTGATEVTFFASPRSCRMHRSGCGVVKRFMPSRDESHCAQTR
jgi:hypothetical protein